jgi:hypothetical protein
MRPHRVRAAASALLLVAGLVHASSAHAQSTTERYSLRGFGGWNLGHTDNQNTYAYVASGDTEYNNYNFALNLAAQPSDKLTVRAQAFWGEDLRGRRIDLDYVFAQWAHSPKLKVRVGKVLSPFGLYTEIYDVGTLRPFYLLPQFYSGVTGLLPKAYLGGGLTGVLPLGDEWELDYDAFGGEVRFQTIPTDVPVGMDPATGMPITATVDVQLIGRPMIGGRLGLGSPSHGFKVGVAAMHADIEQSVNGGPRGPYPVSEAADLVNAYLQWEHGPLTVRSELFEAFADTATLRSTYAEASYKLTRHLQVAGLYERTTLDPDPGSLYASLPDQLKEHESVGLGLNLWATPDVVFKVNGYSVHGNLAARPANPAVDAAMGRLDDSTLVLVVGAQFAF